MRIPVRPRLIPSARHLLVTMVFGVIIAVLMPMATASALGSRVVTRSCGQNAISSYNSQGNGIATTERLNGTCNSRLSVQGMYSSGGGNSGTTRFYGNTAVASISSAGLEYWQGRHWGCDSCAQSTT